MTRIAFTADLHVDEYGSRRDPETGLNARLVDYLETVEHVAWEAEQRECDALVVAGDFTERRHPAPWLVTKIRDALEHFPGAQVYLRGNHDGEIAGGSIVTILGSDAPNAAAPVRWGVARPRKVYVDDVALCLIPYLDRHWLRTQPGFDDVPETQIYAALSEQFVSIARGLYAEAQEWGAKATVLVCHQTIAGAQLSEQQAAFLGDQQVVISAADLGAIGFDGIVAGHLHRHQVISTDPPILYTGSVERVDFGEQDETKGFVIAEVGPARFEWEFIETPARRYVTVDAGPDGEELGTLEQFEGAIVRVINAPPDRDPGEFRRFFEKAGAFEVTEIRPAPAPLSATGGMSESLSAEEALEAYFDGDPEADALIERGREILAEVAS